MKLFVVVVSPLKHFPSGFLLTKSGYSREICLSVLSPDDKELSPAIFSAPIGSGLLNLCARCLMPCLQGPGPGCQ